MPSGPPALLDKAADYEIPAKVWSNWKPAHSRREIVRTLNAGERAILQRRAYALECGLMPYAGGDRDGIKASLLAMFSGFRSLRQEGEDIIATAEITCIVLRDFPAWAIEQACLRIARHESGIEEIDSSPKWAPSDVLVYDAVKAVVVPYRKALDSAQSLLSAPVEQPEDARPTRAEVEAKLGRPITDRKVVEAVEPPQKYDGKHAQRIAADLAARKVRNEQVDSR
jgi:hypothetical protein